MLYLATQFAWFLVVAFAIGLAMGWISGALAPRQPLSRTVAYGFGLWLLVGATSWLGLVAGVWAYWIETALLFVAAYFAGCAVAGLAQGAFGGTRDEASTTEAGLAGSALAEQPAAAEAASDASAELAPSPVEPAAVTHPGEKPPGLPSAREAGADDLKLIKGIGAQNAARLQTLGIWHFDQIAQWTPQHSEWAGSYLAFPGRIEREDWVGQAKLLAEGGDTPHSRKLKRAKAT